MAKLTKVQRRILSQILHDATRARDYVMGDGVAVCHKSSFASTTLHYIRPSDPAAPALVEVQRAYGSDLCGLEAAVQTLKMLLTE